ncbi:MAG: hypothetical protein AMXMBFR58_22840 [Phycisphaerae bacterium]
MNTRHTASALILLLASAGAAARGPVEPPPGSISPSYKTLTDIEPRTALSDANTPGDNDSTPSLYRITQPGSYYLTGNIEVPAGKVAVEIVADNVTLDLSGFEIIGSGPGSSAHSLIQRVNTPRNTTVRNGTIRNAGKHAMELGTNATVEHIRVFNCGDGGIVLVGARGMIDSCHVDTVVGAGISVTSDCRVNACIVYSATGDGIKTGTNCQITDCRVNTIGGDGIEIAYGSTVTGCSVRSAAGWGITSSLNSGTAIIESNMLTLNLTGGIQVYGGSQVLGNTISMSGSSNPCILVVGDGNIVRANLASNGSDAVRIEASGQDNLVVGNFAQNSGVGTGFANVNLAANVVGPVITTAGTISSTNPHANFSR